MTPDRIFLNLISIINIAITFLSQDNIKKTVSQTLPIPWCKYSHHSHFQVTKVMSLNAGLGRNVQLHAILDTTDLDKPQEHR